MDNYMLDAIPEGPALVTFHQDRPGMLGLIGTIMGKNDINISRMQLGTSGVSGEQALGIWNLDTPMTVTVLEEIQQQDGIHRARPVE